MTSCYILITTSLTAAAILRFDWGPISCSQLPLPGGSNPVEGAFLLDYFIYDNLREPRKLPVSNIRSCDACVGRKVLATCCCSGDSICFKVSSSLKTILLSIDPCQWWNSPMSGTLIQMRSLPFLWTLTSVSARNR